MVENNLSVDISIKLFVNEKSVKNQKQFQAAITDSSLPQKWKQFRPTEGIHGQ